MFPKSTRPDYTTKPWQSGAVSKHMHPRGTPFQEGFSDIFSGTFGPHANTNKQGPELSNDRVVVPYTVSKFSQAGSDWHKYLFNQFLFVYLDPKHKNQRDREISRGKASVYFKREPDSQRIQRDGSYNEPTNLVGVVHMNYSIINSCVNEYTTKGLKGLIDLRDKLLENYRFCGVGITPNYTSELYKNTQQVNVLQISGEVDAWNIFGKNITPDDHLFLLLKPTRRNPEVEDNDIDFNFKPDEPLDTHNIALKTLPFYYEIRGYISPTGIDPPYEAYNMTYDEGTEVRGHFWRVGKCATLVDVGPNLTNSILSTNFLNDMEPESGECPPLFRMSLLYNSARTITLFVDTLTQSNLDY